MSQSLKIFEHFYGLLEKKSCPAAACAIVRQLIYYKRVGFHGEKCAGNSEGRPLDLPPARHTCGFFHPDIFYAVDRLVAQNLAGR
ncbi:hypothetical protein V6C21_01900 [[Clostridium] cellulosi]|nr:MAG: hypothetical protein DIU81_03700 [[Clostridium] cellulosi]